MKRHESIVELSREHHFGLLFCWKLRQGIKKQVPPAQMQPYVKYFWGAHLLQHFQDEETLLTSVLRDDLVQQMISEHRHISQVAATITEAAAPTWEQLGSLADGLDAHIRFEERILFPHVEQALTEDQLAELGMKLKQVHPTSPKDDYPDEFWVSHTL